MSHRRPILALGERAPLCCTALAVAALLAACRDVTPAAPEAAPDDARLARGGSSTQGLPTGKGIGTRTSMSSADRTRYKVQYHNGPVLLGGLNVYFIWYGTWEGSATPPVVVDFVSRVGGSAYMRINTLYRNWDGDQPLNQVTFGGMIDDMYSRGAALAEADVAAVVRSALENLGLPVDPSGIVFVLGSADVTVTNGTSASCTSYCGLRQLTTVSGTPIQYAFVGSPARCPAQCAPQSVGPNGGLEADAIVNIVANLISTAITDPFLSAWYDRLGLENADKCAWNFGPTYTAPNGAQANIQLGRPPDARHYLVQQNWVPTRKGGYCSMSAPEPGTLAAEDGATEG